MNTWLVLTATLPTSPSGLRTRVWRALKATGAGSLREGVYLLPDSASTADALRALEGAIVEAAAEAHLLVMQARNEAQEASFRGLFDRTEAYAELLVSIKEGRASIKGSSEAQLHKLLRTFDQQMEGIRAIDFFPGKGSRRATEALTALHREIELKLSPDEPGSVKTTIESRSIEDYQGRAWATRKRPWIDRLATGWLIQRFIDRSPTLTWLADPKKCPKSALGYDFDGATFTHVGDKVTFEVIAESFGLLGDAGLARLARLVHYMDVGGIPMDEAPGVEAIVRGLQASHASDDELLAIGFLVFDALYASLGAAIA